MSAGARARMRRCLRLSGTAANIGRAANALGRASYRDGESDMPDYKVRGPDPDGDYFVVEIVNGEEMFLDEAFSSEEDALAAIEKLTA